MRTYEETMNLLDEMKSRFNSGFSSSDRSFLEKMHRLIFAKDIPNKGCSDCYRDAYLLIVTHLKKTQTMPKEPNYILKAGVLIHPSGTSKFYINPLPSDEIAEDFLSEYPDAINKFAHVPEDWEDRVKAYKERKEKEAKAKAAELKAREAEKLADPTINGNTEISEAVAALQSELSSAKEEYETKVSNLEEEKESLVKQIESLNQLLAEKQESEDGEAETEETNELRMSLETANAELESAKEEINKLKSDVDTLKSENRALKAANTRLKNSGAKEAE